MSLKSILLKILGPLILSDSKILSNERLSPHFQLLSIKGKSLRKVQWIPGQKMQIKMKDDSMRSYTPTSWDPVAGVVQTLIFMHGNGPGALWARDALPASKVTILGPRKSLTLEAGDETIIFFGDETTFGLAHALKKYTENIRYYFFFECRDRLESQLILNLLNLENSPLYGINQHEQLVTAITTVFDQNPGSRIILSGKQQSIVSLRDKLYHQNISPEKISKKIYWGWKDDPNGKLKK